MIFKFKYKRLGGHVHCDLFSGKTMESLGLNGTVIFREEEWEKWEESILFQLNPDGVTRILFEEVRPILSE